MSAILVFISRLVEPDMQAKTRLGKDIHNQPIANKLARALITDMKKEYARVFDHGIKLLYFYHGKNQPKSDGDDHYTNKKQLNNNLCTDIATLHRELTKDYDRIAIVGSDVPLISYQTVLQAFDALSRADMSIVLVADGGFGLAAFRGFVDIYTTTSTWDSRTVGYRLFDEIFETIQAQEKTICILPESYDIDTLADWQRLWKDSTTTTGALAPSYSYLSCVHRVSYDYFHHHASS